ncbi:MAG TPA: alpha/beta fold hydrolase, partial [Candidatus Melainabacteria bacterium]|nr:alpha/beta fold hydrolase [Candidatus Melainabacteria bacterium]
PRRFPVYLKASVEPHLIEVAPGSRVLAEVNLQPDLAPGDGKNLVVVVHGLEGSSNSPYMQGVAVKALLAGFSVLRLNLRNCGGTEELTDTLYNAGMSDDLIAVAEWARKKWGFERIFFVGFSLGGNIVLKAAAELASCKQDENGDLFSSLSAVCAVSPSVDLERSVDRLDCGLNRIYQVTFMRSLREKLKKKAALFPRRYPLAPLEKIRTVKQFDETYTAPDGGFDSAGHYYEQCSSLSRLGDIRTPGLIIAALDDPLVPSASFEEADLLSGPVRLLSPLHGGHGGFLSVLSGDSGKASTICNNRPSADGGLKDRFWAEDRVIEFCLATCEPS